MGRRKIEIEPITNERNRSVTFLKRKNGLFKKAYELGVLCSVDIAVIVFEERPGHAVKLHQYCSGNVHSVIQRHLRHEGIRECRSPHDYNDKLGEGDDDEDEVLSDDEHIPYTHPGASRSVKAQPSGSRPHGRGMPKPNSRAAEHGGPAAKRARLALSLDNDPLVNELTGAGAYRFGSSSVQPTPTANATSSAGLAGLYPPPSSHAWNTVVAGTLAGTTHAQGYGQHQSRQQAYAQQYQGQYALSQSATPPNAGPFDLSVPPSARAASYAMMGRSSEPAYSATSPTTGPGAGANIGDVFDFDWPVHQPQPTAPPAASAHPVAAAAATAIASSHHSHRASAPVHVKQPSSPDLTWLDFLSGPSPPALHQPAAAHATRSELSPLSGPWEADPAGRPGSGESARTAGTFLPSPRSERDEDDEVWGP